MGEIEERSSPTSSKYKVWLSVQIGVFPSNRPGALVLQMQLSAQSGKFQRDIAVVVRMASRDDLTC
jgi:hypothetical protein